jgi:DNA-directed RNA polymerase specialized sigma24 family protein
MYEFDLEQFKSERRHRMHTQPLQVEEFEDNDADESDNTLLNEFFDELTCTIETSGDKSRYWWVDEIEDAELSKRIELLSADDIELITLYVFDGYTQDEIAIQFSCTKQNIQKKFRRIKNFLC